MKIEKTPLVDCMIVTPDIFGDHRGWFMEAYNINKFQELGIIETFIQDNHSYSKDQFTLRGLHFQTGSAAQSKLVRCVQGKIWDVVVDLRVGSPSYLRWFGIELDAEFKKQLYIPKGFAHGFLTLEPNTEVEYKVDHVYSKTHDGGVFYADPSINIDWDQYLKGQLPILSAKDEKNPLLSQIDLDFEYSK